MKFKSLAVLLVVALTTVFMPACKEIEGCTNPECEGYDPEAETNDGSCDCGDSARELSGPIGTKTLYNDGEPYYIDGHAYVTAGNTLTIQPGVVIKGRPGTGFEAAVLIISQGAKIMAEGTAEEPIIFTALDDELNGNLTEGQSGLWGGLVILGNARLNTGTVPQTIEGVQSTSSYGNYGGNNDEDNSGVLKYVSIRHGGISVTSDSEINGLTLGGVGSGTTIEHVEVYANADDGIEFFGGTATVKYAVTAYCGDDSYDYDEGWRGKGQFWVTVGGGERGGEHDGGTTPESGAPYAIPTIQNATYVGTGMADGNSTITMRDNAGGHYKNSIFLNYGKGIDIEYLDVECSFNRFENGEISFVGNSFFHVADSNAVAADIFTVTDESPNGMDSLKIDAFVETFSLLNNETGIDPGISAGGFINLVPSGLSPAVVDAGTDPWFDQVTYRGAVDPEGSNWMEGWTKVSAKF